jgi:hypothetical protein
MIDTRLSVCLFEFDDIEIASYQTNVVQFKAQQFFRFAPI